MDGEGTCGKQAGFHETVFAFGLRDCPGFMRVNGLWNEPVNDANERNSGKKCPSADPVSSFLGAKSHGQPRGAFWKDFHKRDVEHHSGR